MKVLDANVGIGHWSFRRLAVQSVGDLRKELCRAGIHAALVYSLNAVFYKDMQSGNEELVALRGASWAMTSAVVDPVAAGALRDLEESIDMLSVRAVRLFPSYHGYEISDARADWLFQYVAGLPQPLPVLVTMRLEDERLHHRLAKVSPPALEGIVPVAARFPRVPIILVGARLAEAKALYDQLPPHASVYYEISRMTEWEFMSSALEALPTERLVFGTNLPLYTPECGVQKVTRADVPESIKARILYGNLADLLGLSEGGDTLCDE